MIMMQSSSATLGSFTLYRSSIQSLVYSIRNLINMARLAFQGIFLMGAFCCAMAYEPKLEPKKDLRTLYQPTKRGMKIEARYALTATNPNLGGTLTSPQELVIRLPRRYGTHPQKHQFQTRCRREPGYCRL